MKAVSYFKSLPIDHDESLVDVTLERPSPGPRDLLVEVRAISVNPVDAKIRAGSGPGSPEGAKNLLGWDAAGVVVAVGAGVTLFAPGEEVYYAGALDRSGSYAEYQLVDERIVGRKPASIGFAEAAALPLTTITLQLPSTPSRTRPPGLIARIVLGGLSGAAVAASGTQSIALGAGLGVAGGIAGASAGYEVRTRLEHPLTRSRAARILPRT